MQFFIDIDNGSVISGWLIPDNPGETPELVIKVASREDIQLKANVLRTDLRDLGMHSTGLAGFHIDSFTVPELGRLEDVSVVEADSGITIYRRFNPEKHKDGKLLIADSSLLPQMKLMRALSHRFAMSYPLSERLSLETLSGILSLRFSNSIFVSGSLNWMRYGALALEQDFVSCALLRDPFDELAEKLLFLWHLAKNPGKSPLSSHAALSSYSEVLPQIAAVDFSDDKSLLMAFRTMSPSIRKVFRSPMTRLYGSLPEEDIQRRNVSVALDNLAQFSIVGSREQFEQFAGMVNARLGNIIPPSQTLDELQAALELGKRLSTMGLVLDLLDEDVALYSFAKEAWKNAENADV
ncbi:hypothetical protein [Ensifer sp. ZNC0028]|uniref:hypothetical protein n=1 Tax=Ensifer sp. ZNC0028 TaxID=1339236 RepID=UPI0005BC5F78|nr:hypothetical protein [Ensifer sp. ZNC0028]